MVSPSSGRSPSEMQVRIEQGGSGITITIRGDEETIEKLRIGSDNHNQIHGAPMISAVKWEGTTLVVDSVATFGADELRMNDRWTPAFARRAKTLTFKEHHQFKAESAGDGNDGFRKTKRGDLGAVLCSPNRGAEIQEHSGHEGCMPASRLMPVMMTFTKSLQVSSAAIATFPDEFAKDDKPTKASRPPHAKDGSPD